MIVRWSLAELPACSPSSASSGRCSSRASAGPGSTCRTSRAGRRCRRTGSRCRPRPTRCSRSAAARRSTPRKSASAKTGLPVVSVPTTYSGAEWTPSFGVRSPDRRMVGGGSGREPRRDRLRGRPDARPAARRDRRHRAERARALRGGALREGPQRRGRRVRARGSGADRRGAAARRRRAARPRRAHRAAPRRRERGRGARARRARARTRDRAGARRPLRPPARRDERARAAARAALQRAARARRGRAVRRCDRRAGRSGREWSRSWRGSAASSACATSASRRRICRPSPRPPRLAPATRTTRARRPQPRSRHFSTRSIDNVCLSSALAISAKVPDVTEAAGFDVLVIGSGASGLAAAVSAERAGARVAVAAKGSLQSCNSAKAQGGIQAAFGEDDSPEQHAQDVWASSHETADMRLVEVLTGDAQSAIHWLEELGVEFTRDSDKGMGAAIASLAAAARRGSACSRSATAPATRSRRRCATRGRRAPARRSSTRRSRSSSRPRTAGARRCGEHDDRRRRPSSSRPAGAATASPQEQGELSTNHPGATGEVTEIALALGAEARDLDALQYHPNGGAWPANMQGYSIPETTRAYGAVLLNADGEEFTDSLGPRDVVAQAIVDEVAKGKGVETPDGRPAVYLDTTRISEADAEVSLPYMLRRYRAGGIDPLAEKILTYPVLHYQNGGLVIDTDAETTLEGLYACGEIAGGTHGRNRMMGNSLLECVVFGRRAGRAAAEKAERYEHGRHRSPARRRGRRRAPLRLGAEGHPAGPPRRALRRARARDVRRRASASSRRSTATSTSPTARRTSSARTPASPSTTAASASTSRCIRRGSTRRCATAPRARRSSIRCARTRCTRSRARTPGRTSATGCRSCTGSSSRTGTGST